MKVIIILFYNFVLQIKSYFNTMRSYSNSITTRILLTSLERKRNYQKIRKNYDFLTK